MKLDSKKISVIPINIARSQLSCKTSKCVCINSSMIHLTLQMPVCVCLCAYRSKPGKSLLATSDWNLSPRLFLPLRRKLSSASLMLTNYGAERLAITVLNITLQALGFTVCQVSTLATLHSFLLCKHTQHFVHLAAHMNVDQSYTNVSRDTSPCFLFGTIVLIALRQPPFFFKSMRRL